jgi:hypothetical protein
MKFRGPYLTLVTGLAVAGIFIGLSTAAHNRAVDRAKQTNAAAVSGLSPAATEPATQPAATAPSKDAATPAPSTPAPPPPGVDAGTYAGSVNGGQASVAVAVKDGTAIAYVCDGTKVEAWMQGQVAGTSLALTGNKGAALNATYSAGYLSGTIKASGKQWTFRVKAVKPPSGLYRTAQNVTNATVVGGWIVTPDGRQVGMLGRSDGAEIPAPPIDLSNSTVTVAGTVVKATPVSGSAQ